MKDKTAEKLVVGFHVDSPAGPQYGAYFWTMTVRPYRQRDAAVDLVKAITDGREADTIKMYQERAAAIVLARGDGRAEYLAACHYGEIEFRWQGNSSRRSDGWYGMRLPFFRPDADSMELLRKIERAVEKLGLGRFADATPRQLAQALTEHLKAVPVQFVDTAGSVAHVPTPGPFHLDQHFPAERTQDDPPCPHCNAIVGPDEPATEHGLRCPLHPDNQMEPAAT